MKLGSYATLLGVVNGFIVLVSGMKYFSQNVWIGGLLLALGLFGIALSFAYRFATRTKER